MINNGYTILFRPTDVHKTELKDYKLWCFNGEPKMTLVCTDRFSDEGLHEDFFDEDWNHLTISRPMHPNATCPVHKPHNYILMQDLARCISRELPFLRVDFYEIDGQVYFGELTFYPASGFEGFKPEEWDKTLGDWVRVSPTC